MLCEGLANFSATCIRTLGANGGLQCSCGPSVNRESLVKFVCTKSAIFGDIFSYCEGAWHFSVFFPLEAGSAVVFTSMAIWKKKPQRIVCKGRGKISSSAEPIKPSQKTPVSLSWNV